MRKLFSDVSFEGDVSLEPKEILTVKSAEPQYDQIWNNRKFILMTASCWRPTLPEHTSANDIWNQDSDYVWFSGSVPHAKRYKMTQDEEVSAVTVQQHKPERNKRVADIHYNNHSNSTIISKTCWMENRALKKNKKKNSSYVSFTQSVWPWTCLWSVLKHAVYTPFAR